MMTKIKLLMLIIFYLIISASAHAAGGIGQCGRSDERAAHLGDPRRHAGVR